MKVELLTTLSIIGGLTLIQITPIKINPWSLVAKGIKKAIGYYDIVNEIHQIKLDVYELQRQEAEREYNTIRSRVIRFAKEVSEDTSPEEYDYIYDLIHKAEYICSKYGIVNGKFSKAIEKIDEWAINS